MTKQEITENVIGKLLDALEQQDLLKDVEPTDYEEIVAGPVQNIIDKLYKEPEKQKLKMSDIHMLDKLKYKHMPNGNTLICVVTGINTNSQSVCLGSTWFTDIDLAADWEKVEETSE